MLVAGTILFAGGVHLLHGYQVQRNAGALLFQAERAREQGRLDLSAKYLQRYLGFAPEDGEALAKLAFTFDELSATRGGRLRAFLAFEQALRHDPHRLDLRRRLVELAMELHRYGDASAHIQVLQNAQPGEGEVQFLLARCEEARGQYVLAAAAYEKASQLSPSHLESYLRRAVLLRQPLNQPELADQVMADMVRRNEGFRARLFRTRYYRELGMLAEAEMDFAAALAKAPHDADVLLTGAELALQAGHRDRARRFLEEGCTRHANDRRMHQAAAELELADGKPDQAIARAKHGLEIDPNQPDLLAALAELLVEHHQAAEAEQVIGRLRKQKHSAAALDYLEARACMEKEKWREAVRLLERARPSLSTRLALQRQADLSLSRCYAQLGDSERQLALCRRAVAADPSWLPGRLELVAILVASGRIEQALAEQRQIVALPGAPASAWVTLARLLIVHNQRLRLPQRDWREVEHVVQSLEKAAPGSPSVVLARADLLAARGHSADARVLLRKACVEHPDELGPWLALADLAQGADDPWRLLDEAEEKLGDSVALRLARLKHSFPKPGKPSAERIARLEDGIEQFSNDGQAQLFRALGDAWKRLGHSTDAERLWIEAAGRKPGDLRVRVSLFELALQNDNDAATERWLKEIRAIEGGPLALGCEASRFIHQAAGSYENAGLAKARELVAQAIAQRPGLPMLLLREAQIAELEGNPDRAIERYRQVVEKGDAHRHTVFRLLHLLYEQQRYVEADQVIRKLQERSLADRDLQRLAAELSLRTQNAGRAVELARQAVPGEATDCREQLWLGQLLAAAGESEDATRALRRAVELTEQTPGPLVAPARVALVQHLARVGEINEAEQVVARAKTVLASGDAATALAQCYEAIGQLDEAERHYRRALAARLDDPALMRLAAGFYVRANRVREAETLLKKLAESPKNDSEHAAWARRSLALILASKGDRQSVQQGLRLVEANLQATANADDRRAQAHVLAALRDRPSRLKAVKLLEELLQKGRIATADDQFLLAQLYESERDWARARARLRELLGGQDRSANYVAHVAHYARALARRGELEEAQLWCDRLEQTEPSHFQTLEIKVRLLVARNQLPQAMEQLENFLRRESARAGGEVEATRLAALLLDDLSRPEAERFYRRYMELRSEGTLALVSFLGRRGRTQEALDLCDQAMGIEQKPGFSEKPGFCGRVAAAAIAVLRSGASTPAQRQRVEGLLESAVKEDPSNPALLASLADLRDLQGRWREAEALYRQVIERDPQHVIALNNLAWFLVAGDATAAAEALELVNRAITVAGPAPELLDTRALALLALGRTEQAIADLEAAVAERPTPGKQFHLARAHLLANQTQAAKAAWRQAVAAGLQPNKLHALELDLYHQIASQLEP